ncbi:hypothetical protein [Streptomyces luteireticuli]|uniref:hypothetical protein n=1 Tax=Streptomyces luteireticuli TaxID=173858 RepID=UPI003556DBFF
MSVPGGWEFLEELPDKVWPVPEEIAGPTGSLSSNLAIRMLTSDALGNDMVALVGDYLAEGARFNWWFGSYGKGRVSIRQMSECSSLSRESVRMIYEAWRKFSQVYEESNRTAGVAQAEYEELETELKVAIGRLRGRRMQWPGAWGS